MLLVALVSGNFVPGLKVAFAEFGIALDEILVERLADALLDELLKGVLFSLTVGDGRFEQRPDFIALEALSS